MQQVCWKLVILCFFQTFNVLWSFWLFNNIVDTTHNNTCTCNLCVFCYITWYWSFSSFVAPCDDAFVLMVFIGTRVPTSPTATVTPTTATEQTATTQTGKVLILADPVIARLLCFLGVPSNYLYDSTSGFYYDTITGLYYDPKTQVGTLYVIVIIPHVAAVYLCI